MSNYKPEAYKFSNPTHISVKKTLICNYDDPVAWTDPDFSYKIWSRQILFNPRTDGFFETLYSSNTDVSSGKYKDSGDIISFYVRRFAMRITNVEYVTYNNPSPSNIQSPYIGLGTPASIDFNVKKGLDKRYDTALIADHSISFVPGGTFYQNWFLWDNSMQLLIQDNTPAGGVNSLTTFAISNNTLKATNSAHRSWTNEPLYFEYNLLTGNGDTPLSMTIDIWIEMLITKIWNSSLEVDKYIYINRDEAL